MIFVVGVCRVVANLTQARFATVDVREKKERYNVVVVIERDVSIYTVLLF